MPLDGKQVKDASIPAVKLAADVAGDGLGTTSGVLNVNVGTGIETNTDTLRLATQGTGIAGGGGSTLSIDTGSTVDFSSVAPVWTFGNETTAEGLFVTGTPQDATHVPNKQYVDDLINGNRWKNNADLATSVADGNRALTGEQTIDGTLTSTSIVLLKSQTAGAENGLYTTAAGAWTRTTDMDSGSEADSAAVFVESGTENGGSQWTQTVSPVTIDTTSQTWVQMNGLSNVTAGDGLQQTGNTMNIDVSDFAGTGLEDDGSENLRIAAPGNGLTGGGGTALTIDSDDSTGATVAGVNVAAAGVGVLIDNDTIVHNNAGDGTAGDVISVGADSIGTAEIAEAEAFAFTEATGTTETPGDNSTKLATTAYVDAAVAAGTGANPTSSNKFEASAVVSANETTTGLTIASTPAADSHVEVDVNGVGEEVGDAVKTKAFYYSADGGTTPRALADITAADTLYYNAVINGFDLAVTDLISQNYNV